MTAWSFMEAAEWLDAEIELRRRPKPKPEPVPDVRERWIKFPPEQIAEIRRRVEAGTPQRLVAREFGVSKGHVSGIVNGKRRVRRHFGEVSPGVRAARGASRVA